MIGEAVIDFSSFSLWPSP